MSDDAPTGAVTLLVRNLGGIREAEVTFSEGVTLLSGRNASNKSSLLRALAGVLGGPVPPLRSDADEGRVALTVNDETYRLAVERHDGEPVVTDSRPYTDARERCELFVALTETNPIRRAVLAGEELYDHLMAPVETAEIEAEIRELRAERRSLTGRLEEIAAAEERLAACRERRERVAAELAAVEEQLAERRADIDDIEAALAETAAEDSPLGEKRRRRSELTTRIRTHRDAVSELRAELDEVRDRLADFEIDGTATSVEQLDEQLDALHRQKQQLADTINALSSLAELNARLADGELSATFAESVIDGLDPEQQSVTCWTCGTTVERARITTQAEAVEDLVREKRNRRDELTERIQCLTERKRTLEAEQAELDELRRRERELDDEIERRERTLAGLREDRREVEAAIESRVEADGSSDERARLAATYEAVTELEYERGALAADLDDLDDEIDELSATVAEHDDLETQRERIEERLADRRTVIDRLEADLVETFNEEMERMLSALEYDAVARIWLERVETEQSFRLNVVRTTDDGAAYADSVSSLSKSEREVIGLVVALTGYLVHDVRETVPFVVIDAVEMFDADRIRGLLATFGGQAPYVVSAVLPEERAELDEGYETIRLAADS